MSIFYEAANHTDDNTRFEPWSEYDKTPMKLESAYSCATLIEVKLIGSGIICYGFLKVFNFWSPVTAKCSELQLSCRGIVGCICLHSHTSRLHSKMDCEAGLTISKIAAACVSFFWYKIQRRLRRSIEFPN